MTAGKRIEIMDTTLRDGEQTSSVSFLPSEKLQIAKLLLDELKVDRIEVASARVSDGELEGVQKITHWATEKGYLDRVEVLGFVDTPASVNWILKAGAKVMNLLTKGSYNHLIHQLKKTQEEHFNDIQKSIEYAQENGVDVNVYLEDWSNGMRNSQEYTLSLIEFLTTLPIKRIMLPDTLGLLSPEETKSFFIQICSRFPETHFDFHAHNDYDLSVANVMEAIMYGASGIHTTVNGLGERAGNAPLESVIAVIKDFTDLQINVQEQKIYRVSKLVEQFSGQHIPANKPVVGENVFTQTAGIHADGDNKKNLYFNDLLPERFGRQRKYALGKTSGKANILKNLEELGISLEKDELTKVTQRIIELGDKKERVTTEDLPYIISDVLQNNSISKNIFIEGYHMTHSKGLKPSVQLRLNIYGKSYDATATGDGQYDSFMRAIKKIYKSRKRQLPKLIDYHVSIPPGGKTDAFVETVITWDYGKIFKTKGLDPDQTVAAMMATEKMLNIFESFNQTPTKEESKFYGNEYRAVAG
ncbi:alpha-isopropylmalate synthase regulatory domain-containing protein [Algoriphagus sp. D3-2-R+10]|uniref:alpha-isopropylmalate synthase regulatory domain-containing protein n=1 Tax=Algoriphagus aurantiacus TaxID=3103948 RepID=UPI002B3FB804|nr:alpha-isopropylmalate synthase regulatory domain-containing protein [Algoriphagus sp. D3-2-R+10]MEB2776749.1 alpha-isopropylmalate synthase regulatory domain-containing protein [Algoriphagus sp. D3-2-R+10]